MRGYLKDHVGVFEPDARASVHGDYATFNSYHPSDATHLRNNATNFSANCVRRRSHITRGSVCAASPYCLDREEFLFTYAPLIGPHVWLQGEHRWQRKR